MIVTFAYSDTVGHEYNLAAALADKSNPIVIFQIKGMFVDSIGNIGESLTTKLLDNQKWQLKAKRRTMQTLVTPPTILLTGATFTSGKHKGKTISHKQLLEEWYYARSMWIDSGVYGIRSTNIQLKNLQKVIRAEDGLQFQPNRGIIYLGAATFSVETAASK